MTNRLLAAATLGALLTYSPEQITAKRSSSRQHLEGAWTPSREKRAIAKKAAMRKAAADEKVDPKYLNRGARERLGIFRGTRSPDKGPLALAKALRAGGPQAVLAAIEGGATVAPRGITVRKAD